MTTKLQLPLKATKRSRMAPGTQLLPDGSGGVVSHWWEVQWPRIGGEELLPLAEDAFTSVEFESRYQAGELVFIYVAGCPENHRNPTVERGLRGVAERLYACLHKVSVTSQVSIRSRLRELSKDRYGCQTLSGDGYICSDRGFDNWTAQMILPHGEPLAGSPARIGDRCIHVRLPHDMSKDEFDERLHAAMRNASLNDWLDSEEGQAHCAQIGRSPDEFRRFTGYGFAKDQRVSRAKEFYFFRPKSRDADRLVRIAEVIIHDWCMTPPQQRSLTSYKCQGQGYYGRDSVAIGLLVS